MVGLLRQGFNRPAHGEMRGAQDIEAVDFLNGRFGHGPEDFHSRGERGVELFAIGRTDFLRVGQSVEMEVFRQDDRRRHDRAGQRSAPRFIDARHQEEPASAQGTLAGKITGHLRARSGNQAAASVAVARAFSFTVVADLPLRVRR